MSRIGTTLFVMALVAPSLAVAQRPGNTMHTNSAQLYLRQAIESNRPDDKAKYFGQALEAAQQGVQAAAGNSKTWFVLGTVHAAMGNALAADSAFDKAEELWPEYKEETEEERLRAYVHASNAGVQAIQANDLAKAIELLEGAAAVYDKRPTALLNLGSVYARQNNAEGAARAYRAALEVLRGPGRQGLNAEEEKQWAEWEEAVSLNLAQILAMSGKEQEAAVAYEEYLKRNPENSLVLSNLAVVYSRMGKTEDAKRIYNQLLSKDLSAEDFFRVGIGLRRAQQNEQAAEAFRKSLAKNPHSQEAHFNLAYVLWETIQPLEDERAKATGAAKAEIGKKLRPLYEELVQHASKSREMDPTNRNVLALMQRAYRGLADLETVAAKQNEWKLKVPPLIEAYDAIVFEVANVVLNIEEGKTTVEGKVINVKANKGDPLKFRVSLVDETGADMGTQEVTVTAPEVEAETDFKAEFTTAKAPAGWKYAVVK